MEKTGVVLHSNENLRSKCQVRHMIKYGKNAFWSYNCILMYQVQLLSIGNTGEFSLSEYGQKGSYGLITPF